jgi:hypothetical protein
MNIPQDLAKHYLLILQLLFPIQTDKVYSVCEGAKYHDYQADY